MDFAVATNHKGKMKEIYMIGKYLDMARVLKSLGNIKGKVIPNMVVDDLEVTRGI